MQSETWLNTSPLQPGLTAHGAWRPNTGWVLLRQSYHTAQINV